jgi:hypothetical protein
MNFDIGRLSVSPSSRIVGGVEDGGDRPGKSEGAI